MELGFSFNPTLVRLKQEIHELDKWFYGEFQSHSGSIKTFTSNSAFS